MKQLAKVISYDVEHLMWPFCLPANDFSAQEGAGLGQ